MVRYLAANINQGFDARIATLQGIAQLIGTKPQLLGDRDRMREFLQERPALTTLFSGGAFVVGNDGICVAETPNRGREGVNYRDRDYVRESLPGTVVISRLVIGRANKVPIFMIAVPIMSPDGVKLGVLATVITLEAPNFLSEIRYRSLGEGGRFLLVSPKDRKYVLTSDDTPLLSPVPEPGADPMFDRYMDGFEGSGVAVNAKGVEELTSSVHIPLAGWFLVAATPLSEAFAPVTRLERRMYAAAAAASLLAGLVIWLAAHLMLAPLNSAAKAIAAMASATDGGQSLPVLRNDEIGALFESFNTLRETLTVQRTQLTQSNAELEQFAYVVSHDLRQPLRTITSYSTLLERKLGPEMDEEGRQMLDFVKAGAIRLNDMLVSLLEFSRVGRGGEPMAPEDLRPVVDEALAFLTQAIAESQATVQVEGRWPTLTVSRNEMERLFQNLIGNALKYRADGVAPRITVAVAADEDGRGWTFRVADNGIGIDPAHQGRLFQVFQRLHSSREYEGTGIGLAMCRKIVERHGGRIWIESEGVGKGTQVVFTLPGEGITPRRA